NDNCWKNSMELSPFLLSGGTELAAQQTKAYISYDHEKIYIFMHCFESVLDPILQKMSEFKAEKNVHDSNVFEDDCVEIFIKPSLEKEVYYHLAVNSKGTIYDARCQNDTYDKNWSSNAEVKTLVGERAWTIEMSIPFQSFGLSSPKIGDEWRINLCREEKPYKENSCWSPTGGGFHKPSRFGTISFGEMSLGSRMASLGNLQKGKNHLKISFSNSSEKAEVVRVKTFVIGTKGQTQIDRIISRVSPGKLENLEVEYSANSESQYMLYQFLQDGNLLYSSPHFPFEVETVFITKISALGKTYTHPLTEFYIVNGELLWLPLVLQTSIEKKEIKECEAILDIPYFLRLIPHMSKDRIWPSPIKITEKQIRKGNFKYRRYIFNFDSKSITFPEMSSEKDVVVNPLLFKSEIVGDELESARTYKIYYQISFNSKKKTTGEVDLFLLPPFSRKTPQNTVICNWPGGGLFYRPLFDNLNEIVKSWEKTGFTIYDYKSEIEGFYKQHKLVIKYGIPGTLTHLCGAISDIGKYLKKHSEYQAVTANGTIKDGVVSPAHLLELTSPVRNMIKGYAGKMALKYPALSWDYEVSVARPESIGFSKMNIESFRKFAQIPRNIKLTPQMVLKNYRQKWVDFRCRQNAEICKLLQEGIKEANPDCLFYVYSGYQGDVTRERYGVNWKYVSKYVDGIWCGYGRSKERIKDTLKAINGKPLVGGELVWLGYGNVYNQNKTEANLFRRLTDCGGGIMVCYDWNVDGRFYKAISQVASVAADFEGFFKNFDRDDSLSEVSEGGKENVAVLKNGQERLLFLFNSTESSRRFKIKNLNLSSNIVGIDYWDKKIINITPFMEIIVPAYKVKVVHLRDKKDSPTPFTPHIISPLDEKIKSPIPFLIWENRNAGGNIYELEYSLDRKFPQAITKRVSNLSVNYYKINEPLEENKQYFWRVRAIDVVTGKKSSFSEIGIFFFESLLNANAYPLCFSPNNDGKYDFVTFKAEMRKETEWALSVLNKANKAIKTFSGKGEEVSVSWDGKNDKDNLVPEGIYTLALKVKGNVLTEKKVELNMRFGCANPEIEKWCSWIPRIFEGALADKDYNTVYNDFSYSLMLKGNKEDSKAYWSNYRTGTEIPITAGKEYIYTAYVKTEMQGKGQAKISLHFFTKNNRWAAIPGIDLEWKGIEAELKG
ncbi:MAG: sugar-binding protein, partial [bacterium]